MFALLQQPAPIHSPAGTSVKISAEKLKPKTYDEIRQRVEEERRKKPALVRK